MPIKIANSGIASDAKSDALKKALPSSVESAQFTKQLKISSVKILDGDLQSLISKVKSEGEKFVYSPDEKGLRSYKSAIKSFMKKLADSFLSLKEEFGSNFDGEQKVFQLVKRTESEVESLTKETLTENQALGLLGSLDDIRGLVVDVLG